MHLDAIRSHCLAKAGRITEGFPFGEDVLVFKVDGKMFLLCNLVRVPLSINLKCDPERALNLRERYAAIVPGYHMNKKHWNTVFLDGSVPGGLVRELIDHSYECVRTRPGARSRHRAR